MQLLVTSIQPCKMLTTTTTHTNDTRTTANNRKKPLPSDLLPDTTELDTRQEKRFYVYVLHKHRH